MAVNQTAELMETIYGEVPPVLAAGLQDLFDRYSSPNEPESLWDERDVVLITYADQVRRDGQTPLAAQLEWLLDHALDELINIVHFLPFSPYTSDDGFSVVDYMAVDPNAGSWNDISNFGDAFDLMFDLVVNHASQKHEWFEKFLSGDPEYEDFFIAVDPETDLSQVVRPRALPLLTPFETHSGMEHVWTTFSADQVDLNYANPRVMLAMLEVLVEYARRGARIIRLDAIAFLWKEIGTTCMHLPQTHAAVRLMRHVLEQTAPGTLVLTETNVPHTENIRYFGAGDDEAHMVYQFSLPPLLLDAIHAEDTSVLKSWLSSLELRGTKTTFFNFTASHDGVGVRPLEGIVPPERVNRLVDIVREHGGFVNMRSQPDGSESPYELNITYVDAVANRSKVTPAEHSRRFLATQAIMLAIRGIPAVYFHSLVGSPNDLEGVKASGQNRRINRHKYDRDDLEEVTMHPDSLQRRIFDGYQRLLDIRVQMKAFHPNATQTVMDLPGDGLLGFLREGDAGEQVTVLANLTDKPREIDAALVPGGPFYDELAMHRVYHEEAISMRPFQVRWLTRE